jgi:hypothetical protein
MNDTVAITFEEHTPGDQAELLDGHEAATWDVVITDKDTKHAAVWSPATKTMAMVPTKSTHGDVSFVLQQQEPVEAAPELPPSRRLLGAHGALRGSSGATSRR